MGKIKKKAKKPKPEKVDGLSPKDIENIRRTLRQVWSWSYPRRLCIARCTDKKGFPVCEKCTKRTPKIYVDHITKVGEVDGGFIARLWCPSKFLQGLCKKCHAEKTKFERQHEKAFADF